MNAFSSQPSLRAADSAAATCPAEELRAWRGGRGSSDGALRWGLALSLVVHFALGCVIAMAPGDVRGVSPMDPLLRSLHARTEERAPRPLVRHVTITPSLPEPLGPSGDETGPRALPGAAASGSVEHPGAAAGPPTDASAAPLPSSPPSVVTPDEEPRRERAARRTEPVSTPEIDELLPEPTAEAPSPEGSSFEPVDDVASADAAETKAPVAEQALAPGDSTTLASVDAPVDAGADGLPAAHASGAGDAVAAASASGDGGRAGRRGNPSTGHTAGGEGEAEAGGAHLRSLREAWFAEVHPRLARAARLTPAMRRAGLTGTVIVEFELDATGRVLRTSLARSSGQEALDTHALQQLAAIRDLPPPPEALGERGRRFRVPVSFEDER